MKSLLHSIKCLVVPHLAQRYNTVGDYYYKNQSHLQILISELGDDNYHFLVLLHELIEAHLCRLRGIEEPLIKAFDESYSGSGEPGASPDAPYQKEHLFAESIERLVATELGVDWDTYSKAVNSLAYTS